MQKSGKTGSVKLTLAGFVVLSGAVAFAIWLARPQLEIKRKLEAQRDDLARRVERERAEVDELNSKSLRFETDPEFVEHEARRNHRMFPGETEFVFDAPD